MNDKIIDPYTNIPYAELPIASQADNPANSNSQSSSMFLSELRELTVGQGGNLVFRADRSGIWAGAQTFALAPFSVSMAGDVTATSMTLIGGTIRYGKTAFTDTVNAGYFISSLGFYFGSANDATKIKYTASDGTIDHIGTISGRSTAILASAISSLGHFIDDRLDTESQEILAGFTFGASGAIQIGSYSAGVTGDIRISPNGIVGRDKNNNETFAIDATTGNATFAGELVAAAGTLGTITAITITGGSLDINGKATIDDQGNMVVASLQRNDFHWFTLFESLDGYSKTITGTGTITLGYQYIELTTSATTNDDCVITKSFPSVYPGFSWAYRRKIRMGIRPVSGDGGYTCYIVSGYGSSANRKLGFYFSGNSATTYQLYGAVGNGSSQSLVNLGEYNFGDYHDLEAVFTPGANAKFYVDGTLEGTSTTTLPSGTTDSEFILHLPLSTGGGVQQLHITYYDFWQATG